MHFLAQKEWFRGENRVFSGKNGGKKSDFACTCQKKEVTLWAETEKRHKNWSLNLKNR